MLAFQDHFAGKRTEGPSKGVSSPSARPGNPLEKKQNPPLICAGIITSSHGIQGHVKVKSFLEDPASFVTYSPFYNEAGEPTYRIAKIISHAKDMLTIFLEGVHDRTAADALKGAHLMMVRTQLPPMNDDTFYHADLVGLQVLSPSEAVLGTVYAVYNFGAGDILEVKVPSAKLEMIPFSKEIVPVVDLENGMVQVSQDGELLLKGGQS